MNEKFEEVNYKKNFCEKYFDKGTWDLDVLNQVDVLLKDKKGNYLLYIESKYMIRSLQEQLKARAQVILTNKKQKQILSHVALIYQNENKHNILEYINCSDNAVMYNNDINWKQEKPSNPTKDAIDRINDRIRDKITYYIDDEIIEFYKKLKKKQDIQIDITENNFNVVYNQWKNEVKFKEEVKDEQDLINLFLADLLNNTKYKKSVISNVEEHTLFGTYKIGTKEEDGEQDLIREGTNLSKYEIKEDAIVYHSLQSSYYEVKDKEKYNNFWKKYKRPPEKHEFLKILERSATLYSDKYRRDTGGEYTPTCFVEKQNEILTKNYNLNEFIVCDPCAGVGNLENQFGKEFKQYCYLSTLEQTDVDICKIKGFENSIKYDYLLNDEQPKWKYKGTTLDITEIAKRENKKLMIIMNPPYKKQGNTNKAILFFNKALKLKPQVIVFYYMTESFLRDEIEHYKKSGYKIVSHIFSNAKTTFLIKEWPISQVVFDKDNGDEIKDNCVKADRYELERGKFNFKKTYIYDNSKPNLLVEIDKKIRENKLGFILGNYSYMSDTIFLGNSDNKKTNLITTENLKYCLLSKGINFNTHPQHFERNNNVYKGTFRQISKELFNDSIMFSMFYKKCAFSNKGQKNYIMPFTSEELDCSKNDLNVLFPKQDKKQPDLPNQEEQQPFDFREFLKQFEFSKEAKNLYFAALEIFKYYHNNSQYTNKDYNDSFYDITNAIMGKDSSSFRTLDSEADTRVTVKNKTTKGTKGFGRNTIKYVVNSKDLPIFEKFFDARDVLAKKINRQLVEQGLLLWERENIY